MEPNHSGAKTCSQKVPTVARELSRAPSTHPGLCPPYTDRKRPCVKAHGQILHYHIPKTLSLARWGHTFFIKLIWFSNDRTGYNENYWAPLVWQAMSRGLVYIISSNIQMAPRGRGVHILYSTEDLQPREARGLAQKVEDGNEPALAGLTLVFEHASTLLCDLRRTHGGHLVPDCYFVEGLGAHKG